MGTMNASANTLLSVPIGKKRLHEQIVNVIEHRILSGDLKPGDKLPTERELASLMQVNRGTVREALGKLESMELLDIRHGDGVYVKDYLESGNLELIRPLLNLGGTLDVRMVVNILELRRLMVPEMAAGAAVKRNEAHVADLRRLIDDGAMSMQAKDVKLHRIIAQASGNILYVITLNFFYRISRDVLALYFDREDTLAITQQFHNDIFHAVQNRQPEKAKQIMEEILAYAEEKISATLSLVGAMEDHPG